MTSLGEGEALEKQTFQAPGVRLLIALAAALVWGVACAFPSAPFWPIAVGGLAAAALAMWLEWEALTRPVPGRKADIRLLLVLAYVFLAVIGIGVASVGYFVGEWMRARL
jgi:phosphotransferase system  glucose/maltose/N-acetylglucosamine-specific IIC component